MFLVSIQITPIAVVMQNKMEKALIDSVSGIDHNSSVSVAGLLYNPLEIPHFSDNGSRFPVFSIVVVSINQARCYKLCSSQI